MTLEIKLTHNGVEYPASIMKITSTMLGYEDHGILTSSVACEGGVGGVSFGGYAYDQYDKASEARVVGNGFGLDQIMQIMRVVGVSKWEALPGKQVAILESGSGGWGSRVVGISSLDGERVLIFKDHAQKWTELEEKAS